MIKSLKRKFITITMISVTAVFLIILGVINIVNYSNVISNANEKLDMLADNNGTLDNMKDDRRFDDGMRKDKMNGEQNPENSQDVPPAKPDGENNEMQKSPPQNMTKDDRFQKENKNEFSANFVLNNTINAETPFETRYFNVTLDKNGEVVSYNVDNIAAVTSDDAISIAKELYSDNNTSGNYSDYMYRQITSGDNIMYIFLDCKRDLSAFRTFLMVSLVVALIGLILVFILTNILAKINLKPVFESYAKQKQFITDASHELKTPVAIISADVEIIEMENGESEWTKSITKQADRLTKLTEQMVFLSRMDEGAGNAEFVDIDASELFKEVSESFEPLAVKKNKTLNIYIDSGIHIKGDEKNIAQMLSLLIDNALKYSDENGHIDVAFHKNSTGKVLKVSNSVDSITAGGHDELFDRFYRRDASRNSKTGGFGIGLSVVHSIAVSHGAKISAYAPDEKSIYFKVVF